MTDRKELVERLLTYKHHLPAGLLEEEYEHPEICSEAATALGSPQSLVTEARLTLSRLQQAHVERQEEWCPDQKPDLSFRGNEMAGEVGEACNVIKKLERERQGWRGSRATKEQLAEELADVVHTAVLCAITAGIEIEPAVIAKFDATSEKNGLTSRLEAALSSPAIETSPVAVTGQAEARMSIKEWIEECRKNPDKTMEQIVEAAALYMADAATSPEIDQLRAEVEKLRAKNASLTRALAEEREACAKLAEDFSWVLPMFTDAAINEATDDVACIVQKQIAVAIRKRDTLATSGEAG